MTGKLKLTSRRSQKRGEEINRITTLLKDLLARRRDEEMAKSAAAYWLDSMEPDEVISGDEDEESWVEEVWPIGTTSDSGKRQWKDRPGSMFISILTRLLERRHNANLRELILFQEKRTLSDDSLTLELWEADERWDEWYEAQKLANGNDMKDVDDVPGGWALCELMYLRVTKSESRLRNLQLLREFNGEHKVYNYDKDPMFIQFDNTFEVYGTCRDFPVLPALSDMELGSVEQLVRKVSSLLAEAADTTYREFLAMAFTVTNDCISDMRVPDSLEQLMAACENSWKYFDSELLKLLFKDLLILQDSEKKSRTSFSPSRGTITFFDGSGKELGPLSLKDCLGMYSRYRDLLGAICSIPSLVYRRYWMTSQRINLVP